MSRELCQRAGAKAYIAGSISSLGSEYVLGLKAMNCNSGDTLAQEQVTANGKEKVLNAVGDAAAKLRGRLGESLATVQKFDVPLPEATTASLEALKAYSLGEKTFGESSAADALPFYQRAIELDPSFPAAYAALGNSYYSLAEEGRAIEYYVKAFQLRAHASEREKLDISGDYYASALGDLNKATEVYPQKVRMYPRDPRGYFNLGGVYSSLGQYEKAIEKYRQSISVSPDRVDAYENLINALLALRRFDEAAQTAEQAQARKLDDTTLHNALYALAFLSRDSSGMEEQQRWYVGRIDENVGLSLQSDTEAYAGHMRKARELTTRAVDSAIRGDSKETAALWQEIAAQREAVSGNTAYATEAAVQGLKLYPASHEVKAEAALALAMAGDLSRAEALVQDLNRQYPHATQIQAIWLPSVADSPIELGTIDFVANLNCLYPKYIRAEAYLAAGQGTRAAAEFQKVVDNSGIVWNCWTGALARLGMARANALQAKNSTDADADAAHVRARRLQRFPHPLERRRSRHSHLQSSQS